MVVPREGEELIRKVWATVQLAQTQTTLQTYCTGLKQSKHGIDSSAMDTSAPGPNYMPAYIKPVIYQEY